ncbi:FtsX-like permease family protein [compost metagenome]
MLGVINSLINSILSKRKEFAVLRAIGGSPKGIAQMILSQVILYIGVGIAVGSLIGTILVVLVLLLDPTKIVFNIPVVGLVSMSMLIISVVTFIAVSRYLTARRVPLEMTMDGK